MKVNGLYVITDRKLTGGKDVEAVEDALMAGCKIIQYREKELSYAEMLEKAKRMKKLCMEHGAFFFVNDHVRLAVESGADGLHLGLGDASLEEARKSFGGMIGASASTLEEAMNEQEADYLGVGPVFETPTKLDAKPPCGLSELRRVVKASKKPVIAIGGITLVNVREVMNTGAAGVAVISAIMGKNVFEETRKFLGAMK